MSDLKAKKNARLDEVLKLATGHAKGELGDADNKKVNAVATLTVSTDDASGKESCGVEAGVTLGVTHSAEPAKTK